MTSDSLPLAGTVVVDVSRMLPGAVLARCLLDLGARVIKVEDPGTGDLMRHAPPLIDGVGAGFIAFFRGAESVGLDLRTPAGAAALRTLAAGADVMVESFRPGTMARFGLPEQDLLDANPGLVLCSLPGFSVGSAVGHDLNFTGLTGLLRALRSEGIVGLQLADVTSGLLACSSVLAALLRRARTGKGGRVQQPLLTGPLPFVTWAWAERAGGGGGMSEAVLGGRAPAYRAYRCGDGRELSVGCLEPKFWIAFTQVVGRPDLAGLGLDTGPSGQEAAAAMEQHLAGHPRDHWLALLAPHDLPVWPVHDLDAAPDEPHLSELTESTPTPAGSFRGIGPFFPSLGRTPERSAPGLGEHTDAVLAEFARR
ncbi:CaiB/BaiF CoA transferase family protein [Nannocystis radixulma]|uniref:CaiB/BaiF CoA-transferase family protein n=1 Tax=Nannocystis radixulma TaxID=2995305 RepID=A0ABT5B367_9BACT|nr:CaiB/BaiF CoA-transferase family protein [Nannocystis radixulma]MDC0667521.1 CaiB/BaiF CoA-transferase family protein [Nannocystis radixulma]